jgi:mono/diheme cytochrome c family protein
VDIAVSTDGKKAAIAAAGSHLVLESPLSTFEETDALDTCWNSAEQRVIALPGEPIAVAYDGEDNLVVQVREPPTLERYAALSGSLIDVIWLSGESRADTGHKLFHGDPDAFIAPMIACASCHPEGGDDGHVWVFNPLGKRRTQGLAGGVLQTLPLHWDGGMDDLGAIMESVFMGRMGGTYQGPARIEAFGKWIDTIPAVPASEPVDEEAAVRGKALFNDPTVGCATCHSGPMLTNNLSTDVGTGGKLQVPSLLGIGLRAPFMHDGCAPTLHDRFGACGGGDKHGVTSGLTPAQIDDLVAYLMTL